MLEKSGFAYSACRPFAKKKKKKKERIQNLKATGDSRYIYQNELDKACFQHVMVYGDFKDLTRKQFLIKYCVNKYLILLKIWNMMDCWWMFYWNMMDVLLIFSVNTHRLFLWMMKKVFQLLMLFKKF